MTTSNQSPAPRHWTNKNGSLLSDEQLKKVSKNWSTETWEAFLTETVEQEASYQRDLPAFGSPTALDNFSETIWEGQDSERMDEVAKGLRLICRDHLTPRQQHIIRSTYWDGLSERQISELLDISRSTIRTQKERSHEKIKSQVLEQKLLEGGRHTSNKSETHQQLRKKTDVISSNSERQRKDFAQESFNTEIKKQKFAFRNGGAC